MINVEHESHPTVQEVTCKANLVLIATKHIQARDASKAYYVVVDNELRRAIWKAVYEPIGEKLSFIRNLAITSSEGGKDADLLDLEICKLIQLLNPPF